MMRVFKGDACGIHDECARKQSNLPAVAALFFTAPLIAEFLLGIFPLKMLPILIVLAPMYGGAALLTRETVRRRGLGWLSILILGLAYGLIEEGFATQSLFNPNYLSMNMHLLDPAYIPRLGIGGSWTVYVLTLHVVWSIATPIALIEGLFPEKAKQPWLGRVGIAVVSALFVAAVGAVAVISCRKDHFLSSPMQFTSAGVLCVALIVLALCLPHPQAEKKRGWAPNAWLSGAIALVAGSGVMMVPRTWKWGAVAFIVGVDAIFCALGIIWGQRENWNQQQTVAMGAGAALAYAWHAFLMGSLTGSSALSKNISHAVFALSAVVLIIAAIRRTSAFMAVCGLRTQETSLEMEEAVRS